MGALNVLICFQGFYKCIKYPLKNKISVYTFTYSVQTNIIFNSIQCKNVNHI